MVNKFHDIANMCFDTVYLGCLSNVLKYSVSNRIVQKCKFFTEI